MPLAVTLFYAIFTGFFFGIAVYVGSLLLLGKAANKLPGGAIGGGILIGSSLLWPWYATAAFMLSALGGHFIGCYFQNKLE